MSSKITPYSDSSLDKKHQVAAMFNNIARRYDFLNHFLSFGIDRYWRKKAIRCLEDEHPKLILDIATGTGDLAIEGMKLNPKKIYGVDISSDMINIGKNKIRKKNLQEYIELIEGDSENLFFEDNKFDAVTVAFGVRNFDDLNRGLKEMHRVLRPGGKTVILEFSKPGNRFAKILYTFYSAKICPRVGKMISKDKAAYTYLHKSVEAFPAGNDFLVILLKAGFKNVTQKPLTFGVVSIYTGMKEKES